MAPAKASAATKGAPAQRSIASFFSVNSASGAAAKKKSPKKSPQKKSKEILSIPSEGGETRLQSPPSKRGGLVSSKKNQSGDEDEKSMPTSSPISPDFNARKNDEGTKSKHWISTPSPCEPAKSGTKTFGRRDRKALKSGVVAPVLNSTDHPSKPSTKTGGTMEKGATPESLIGKRLKVFWPLDKVWYAGKIRAYNQSSGSHTIRYDDGEDESIVLENERIQWLDEATERGMVKSVAKPATAKHARGPSSRRNSPNLKRKKVVDEDDENDDDDELEDSLLDELKNDEGDEVHSDVSKSRKRLRVDPLAEDSPAKVLTVTTDVYDEVDITMPEQEEVKVRKRLRKAVGKAPEKTRGDAEEADEEDQKAGKRTLRKSSTSARRLQLEDAADEKSPPNKNSTKLDDDDSLDESFNPSSAEADSDGEQTSAKKRRKTASNKCDAPKPALDTKSKSQARDFFSKLSVKLTKSAAGTLPSAAVKSMSPPKDGSSEGPKVLEADKLTKGELHSSLVGEAAERFGGRLEEKFRFLGKARRDGSGRRPSDSDYDPRTVLLPPEFLKGLSGGQRQWWEFKSKHMDKVLLFKMGKFYEMFEMDAHVGAQELDLQYMKGDQPHCGFPEKLYFENAEKLARKGYRVLVVEQTETPDQLEQRKRETGAKDKVVRREVCAILTKGTIVDGEMLETSPDAAYLMSITEMAPAHQENSVSPENSATMGVCFVDTSTSHIMLSQFDDDAARSRLRSVLSELRPVELIKPRGVLTEATERAIKDHTRQPLLNLLAPGQEFWDAQRSREEIVEVYNSFSSSTKPPSGKARKKTAVNHEKELQMLPKALRLLVEAGSRGEAALSALGGCIFYLREALLDKTILRLGRTDLLPGSNGFSMAERSSEERLEEGAEVGQGWSSGRNEMLSEPYEPYMVLDSAALENLEIIENNKDGGTCGTLLAHFDACVTPYGRRLLKKWLVRPLMRVEPIMQRQQALGDLQDVAADAAINFRQELKSQSDMERLLARLHASSGACGRNADNVVLYEDAAKKQLQEFTGALRGCRALLRAMKSFEGCLSKLTSNRLRELVTPGLGVPDMAPVIDYFETAFDGEEAERTGRIVPHEGVDSSFDEAESAVKTATQELADYLVEQRKKFGNSSELCDSRKEQYQMEIPEKFHAKVPSSYEVKSSRKGYRRYWTPDIKELLLDLAAGEQQRELALRGILQGLVKRFCEDYPNWLALVKSVAEVDVLISLSEAGHSASTCRPTFVKDSRKIVAEGIRHPIACINLAGGGSFVPNDVALGGDGPPFMLLTGPNMGGKSTLIRQVCLAVVSAQIGANVTADQFELSPVDRMFVRMGAKDHIMSGQSTFLVELSETATMLRSATRNSLVALDELGRGTSTSDGQAIAHAVLEHLAHNVGCRGMFSTHYHRLATHFASDPKVGLHHMSCKVGIGEDGLEEVVFLYKLAAGACPKSYGVNVARLAGMPESVLRRATERAEEIELLWAKRADHSSQAEPKDSAAADSFGETVDGSESELAVVKEVVGMVKNIPEDVSTEVGHSALLLLWQEAKRILGTCGDNTQSSLVVEQEPGICA
ncbi:unnamed protein product [Calypogeia fissa]